MESRRWLRRLWDGQGAYHGQPYLRPAGMTVDDRIVELEERVLELEKAMAILLATPNWSELPAAPEGT